MANLDLLEKSIPVAPIKIAALKGCEELGKTVNDYLVQFRKELMEHRTNGIAWSGYAEESFLIDCDCPRFGTGEAKGVINESIRGVDLFILCDITNYSITYKVNGYENHMSPDDHFQDLKRIIAAATGKAHRINVVMPFLYEGISINAANVNLWTVQWLCRSWLVWVFPILSLSTLMILVYRMRFRCPVLIISCLLISS